MCVLFGVFQKENSHGICPANSLVLLLQFILIKVLPIYQENPVSLDSKVTSSLKGQIFVFRKNSELSDEIDSDERKDSRNQSNMGNMRHEISSFIPISVLTDSYKATHFEQYPEATRMVAVRISFGLHMTLILIDIAIYFFLCAVR